MLKMSLKYKGGKVKKILFLSLIVLFISTIAAAQGNRAEPITRKGMKSVYLELGGNGLYITLNYEHFLSHQLALRAGGMILPSNDGAIFFGTLMGNMVMGDGNLCLETGLGLFIYGGGWEEFSSSGSIALTGTVGLRYHPKRSGVVLRLGFTPIVASGGVFPWVGASIGYTFK